MKELAQQECANYDEGYCAPRDRCCVPVCEGRLCRYFAEAVLQQDEELEALVKGGKDLLDDPALQKNCVRCGKTFTRTNNRQVYCEACGRATRLEKERERKRAARRQKSVQSAFETEDSAAMSG